MHSTHSSHRRSAGPLVGLFASIVAAVGAACGGPSPSDSVAPTGPSATAVRDGIRVSLTLDTATLPSGDRTRALVTVENTSSERRLWQGGGCNFLASITVTTAAPVTPTAGMRWPGMAGSFKELLQSAPGPSSDGIFVDDRFADPTNIGCPADLGVNELSAGQRLEMTATWNGEVNGAVAAPGPARVSASFPYLGRVPVPDPLADQPQPIEAVIEATVVDTGIRLLSPGQVIDAALGNPEFRAWLASAGQMERWDGVGLEGLGHAYVVVLSAGGLDGRATVDRVTGAVTFERRART